MLDVRPTDIPGVVVIATKWFGDDRGAFSETYNRRVFSEAGIDVAFIQDNQALSGRVGTLRGFHFQHPPAAQSKLVRVVKGAVYDVAVDIRPGSPTFGRWAAVELSAANRLQLFIPVGFAHGYVTLEPDTEMLYKVDAYYDPDRQGGIVWDDPDIAVPWPLPPQGPLMAPRDAAMPRLMEIAPVAAWAIRP
jgi:dTDP-4-dehydrorhamnose 3,5-epimerase